MLSKSGPPVPKVPGVFFSSAGPGPDGARRDAGQACPPERSWLHWAAIRWGGVSSATVNELSEQNAERRFQWPVRVYYEDTDCGGVVYHTGYLRFMERARTEWLRAVYGSQSDIRAELGILFAVRRLEMSYLKPATLDDELSVESVAWNRRRTSILFTQSVWQASGRHTELCRGHVEVVCMDASTRRPRPIPDVIRAELSDVR